MIGQEWETKSSASIKRLRSKSFKPIFPKPNPTNPMKGREMSELKHTSGPWKYEHLVGVFSDGRCIARMDWGIQDDIDAMNGRVISAAPDMLAALEALLSEETVGVHVGYDSRGNYVYAEAVRTDSDAFDKIRRLIAKVRQET